jgi:hypothetical protein
MEHRLVVGIGFPTSTRGDPPETQQRLSELFRGNYADQICVAYERPGWREVELAKSIEPRDSPIEGPICGCAKSSKKAGTGVMDPESGQVNKYPLRSPAAKQTREGVADRSGRLCKRNPMTSIRSEDLHDGRIWSLRGRHETAVGHPR